MVKHRQRWMRLCGAILAMGLTLPIEPMVAQDNRPTPGDGNPPGSQSDVTNPPTQELIVPEQDRGVQELVVPLDQRQRVRSVNVSDLPPDMIVQVQEEYQSQVFASFLGLQLYGTTVTANQISERLTQLARRTRERTAVIYVKAGSRGLDLVMVLPQPELQSQLKTPITLASARLAPGVASHLLSQNFPNNPDRPWLVRQQVAAAVPSRLQPVAQEFRAEISDPRKIRTTSYRTSATQLYQWLIAPLEAQLQANRIDTLVFCLDDGLRSLPLGALFDGQQFLIEKYNLALIPSFSLTDTSYTQLQTSQQMLGMGISEAAGGLSPLPAVAVEVPTLTQEIWRGRPVLNQDSTLGNLEALTRSGQYRILHLATHAEFRRGDAGNSFIQLWDTRLTLNRLRSIARDSGWNPTLDLLVLSACQTALGNQQAELGFVGLAVQSGVETALGSLWRVSDEGSLGLMTGFYQQLAQSPTRATSLRQAQLAMLRGEIRIAGGQLQLPGQAIALPLQLQQVANTNFTHPYFWSAFQIVGNWN